MVPLKLKSHKWKFLAILVFLFFMIVPATAHPGRTDANGGHYDRSTGEYHYHHGYPAHQHTGGVCPYAYDDKTGQNSGSSSSGSSYKSSSESSGSTSQESSSEKAEDEGAMKQSTNNSYSTNTNDNSDLIRGLIIAACIVSSLYAIDFVSNRNHYLRKFDGKSCKELSGCPESSDPEETISKLKNVKVCMSKNGKVYHNPSCRHAINNRIVDVLSASKRARPCKVCNPPGKGGKYDCVFRYIEFKKIKKKSS